jgi:hypothetical protein
MNKFKTTLAAAAATLLLAPATPAAPAEDSPVAGPLQVHVYSTDASTGWLGAKTANMEFLVENLSATTGIHVQVMDPVITFSDGSKMKLRKIYHGPFAEQLRLDPENAKIDFPFVLIPDDAPLGIATVEIRAHVASLSGPGGDDGGVIESEAKRASGGLRHSDWAPNNHAVATATFLVLE